MGNKVTAYDWDLRTIDKASWPGDMEPSWEFQQSLASLIVTRLEGRGFLHPTHNEGENE